MKPYYQDDSVTIYHGDCREVDAWLSADVLVTDPPYGMAFVSSWTTQRRPIAGDTTTEARDAALSMWGDKPAAMFGTWKIARPVGVQNIAVWDKGDSPGMGDLEKAWGHSWEEIYILGDWPRTTRRVPSVVRVREQLSGGAGLAKVVGHPTPKPIALMQYIIGVAPLGVIADPFCGSGSTLIAAKALGRAAIGVELEERYCEIAARRCSQETLNLGAA